MRVLLAGILGSSLIVPVAFAQPAPGGATVSPEQVMDALHQQLVGAETLENYWWSRANQLAAQVQQLQSQLDEMKKIPPHGSSMPVPMPPMPVAPTHPAGGIQPPRPPTGTPIRPPGAPVKP